MVFSVSCCDGDKEKGRRFNLHIAEQVVFNFKSSARIIVAKGRPLGKKTLLFRSRHCCLKKLVPAASGGNTATSLRDANFALMDDIDRYDDIVHGFTVLAAVLFFLT